MKWLAVLLLVVLVDCQPATNPPYPGPYPGIVGIPQPAYLPMIGMNAQHSRVKKGAAGGPGIGGWYYDWNTEPVITPGYEVLATIFGCAVPARVGGNSKSILGYNEPDKADQANCSPEQGAMVWRQIEDRYGRRSKNPHDLIAPAPSQEHPEWLVQFRNSYINQFGEAPELDALSVHCYQTARFCRDLLQQYEDLGDEWGVQDVWITEFAYLPCWGGLDVAIQQMRDMVHYWEEDGHVSHYGWYVSDCAGRKEYCFAADCNTALLENGQLTPLGAAYETATGPLRGG